MTLGLHFYYSPYQNLPNLVNNTFIGDFLKAFTKSNDSSIPIFCTYTLSYTFFIILA